MGSLSLSARSHQPARIQLSQDKRRGCAHQAAVTLVRPDASNLCVCVCVRERQTFVLVDNVDLRFFLTRLRPEQGPIVSSRNAH